MRRSKILVLVGTLVALVAATLAVNAAASVPQARAASGFAFTNYQLGTAFIGESCPNATVACTNLAAEPAIRADAAGRFYGSSENGLGGGTQAWRSSDGGLHYTTLASPNALSQTSQPTVAPGGGDTDLAVATAPNANGLYNVYVASLNLASVDVSTSTDGGNSWSLNPIGANIVGDDREWIAADGASKVCISYHDIATFNIIVNCSTDAGTTFTQTGQAFDTNHLFSTNANEIGNLAIDPASHIVYQTYSSIDLQDQTNPNPVGNHVVYMAVSTDGGQTFTDHTVFDNPNVAVSYGHQFVNVSVDSAGNVYSVFTDDHNVSYSFSTDHGQTWSAPVQVNAAPANTAIMPWSVAGGPGKLDIVYYGTSYFDGVNTPDNYPSSAAWNVYFAQNLKAAKAGSKFTQVTASPVNHFGGACESGVTCTGNRDLFDDFGVAANPTTGLASIIYSDDQFDAAQPTKCTQAQNNTSSCDHTSVATQTGGGRIFP